MKILWVLVAEVVPALVLFGAFRFERWRRKKRGERPPVSTKLLREPCHTLRRQLEERQEMFGMWLVFAMLGGVVFGLTVVWDAIPRLAGFGGGGLAAVARAVMTWRTYQANRPIWLGLMGEQAVAEHLQKLVAQGYQVFHDVPGGGKWNIDHVAVGPAGVFAIETKTRTKRRGSLSDKDYEVKFDGRQLTYPWGTDTKAPEQARANARWLATEMSKATGRKVSVEPMLAIPGWNVAMTSRTEMKALNPGQLAAYVGALPQALNNEAIQQVSYQLDQRCRDVEF